MARFKRSVGSFQVSPDGESIYLIAEDEGHDRLYVVPATGGEVREVGHLESGTLVAGRRAPRVELDCHYQFITHTDASLDGGEY